MPIWGNYKNSLTPIVWSFWFTNLPFLGGPVQWGHEFNGTITKLPTLSQHFDWNGTLLNPSKTTTERIRIVIRLKTNGMLIFLESQKSQIYINHSVLCWDPPHTGEPGGWSTCFFSRLKAKRNSDVHHSIELAWIFCLNLKLTFQSTKYSSKNKQMYCTSSARIFNLGYQQLILGPFFSHPSSLYTIYIFNHPHLLQPPPQPPRPPRALGVWRVRPTCNVPSRHPSVPTSAPSLPRPDPHNSPGHHASVCCGFADWGKMGLGWVGFLGCFFGKNWNL